MKKLIYHGFIGTGAATQRFNANKIFKTDQFGAKSCSEAFKAFSTVVLFFFFQVKLFINRSVINRTDSE